MVDFETFRQMALSFPGSTESPHFERTSFRLNKKIFATGAETKNIAVVMLPLIEQSVFCAVDKTMIYPVAGGWGKKGATAINLKKVRKTLLNHALATAYNAIIQKKKTAK